VTTRSGTLRLDEPPDPLCNRLSSRVLPLRGRFRGGRLRRPGRRGAGRGDERQDGHVRLVRRDRLLRVRHRGRLDHPGRSRPPQAAGEGGPHAAAHGLVEQQVTYERRGAAAIATINRPERRNAVDGPTAELLADAFQRFEADDDARVFILTGAGEAAFCAGADLKNIESLGPRIDLPEGPLGFTRRIASKPTIAAIAGWCLAGGLELALWCDVRIATADAKLGFPERRWGVPLIDGGTQRLPRIVGLGRAMDMILTGRIVPAPEAVDIGLVNEVVPEGRHLERALEYADGLAAFPQETMLADRKAALEGIGLTFEEGLKLEAESGMKTLEVAWRGAARFAGGEGRGGAGAGV
jgi:enoyl-CoA hydratase